MLARRDTGEKISVNLDGAVARVRELLQEIQENMYAQAVAFRDQHLHVELETLADLEQHIEAKAAAGELAGWALLGWCGDDACEAKIKEVTKFTSRNIPFDPPVRKTTCAVCGQSAQHTVWFARAY